MDNKCESCNQISNKMFEVKNLEGTKIKVCPDCLIKLEYWITDVREINYDKE